MVKNQLGSPSKESRLPDQFPVDLTPHISPLPLSKRNPENVQSVRWTQVWTHVRMK